MKAPLSLRVGFLAAASVVRPAMNLLTAKDWSGLEHIPDTGFILVANHISELDPPALAHMVYNQGHLPHVLAKAELFRIPVVGKMLHGMHHIPVERTRGGGASLEAAERVLAEGGAILIYPEGTITHDPQLWPMKAKTGAARLALKTGAPVIPVGQWGIQAMFPRHGRYPRVWPRKNARIKVGPPVQLDDLRTVPHTRSVLEEATERIMTAITTQVEDLRGETMQVGRFDPRTGTRNGDSA